MNAKWGDWHVTPQLNGFQLLNLQIYLLAISTQRYGTPRPRVTNIITLNMITVLSVTQAMWS